MGLLKLAYVVTLSEQINIYWIIGIVSVITIGVIFFFLMFFIKTMWDGVKQVVGVKHVTHGEKRFQYYCKCNNLYGFNLYDNEGDTRVCAKCNIKISAIRIGEDVSFNQIKL